MWFQNRRAKWRKQARLSLLQDAWRLRCLGLTNSSSMIPNEHQRQSPKSDTSPSSPIPLITQGLSNSPLPKIVDMKLLKDTSDDCGPNSMNKNESFTLMHPAFQNVLHKRKYYGSHGIDNGVMFDKCSGDRGDARNCNNLLTNVLHSDLSRKIDANLLSESRTANQLKNGKNLCDNDDISQDSSGSEEIDLTSNGIDFSNNNNDTNHKNQRKSDKCAMNTF